MSQGPETSGRSGLGRVLRGALHLLTGQVLRLLSQSVYLVLVTRGLGADDFGRYSTVQALLLGLTPFTGLGFPILALRAVARDPGRRAALWSGGFRTTLLLGGAATLLVTAFVPALMHLEFPRFALLLFALSELILAALINLMSGVLQGQEALDRMARLLAGLSVARLALLLTFALGRGLTLGTFAVAHAGGSLLCLLVALTSYGRGWVWPLASSGWSELRRLAGDGFWVALSGSGRNFLLGLDRMLMPSLAGLTVTGQYSAGYRVAALTLIPLQALMAALYPRFFRRGAGSFDETLRLWRRSAPLALAYALPMAALLFALAPLLGLLLGGDYPEAPAVLRALVWLLVLMALYSPLGDALSGADHFAYRSVAILGALAVNLGLNLILIPRLGWMGAVWSAYAAHTLLLLLYAGKVMAISRSERRRRERA